MTVSSHTHSDSFPVVLFLTSVASLPVSSLGSDMLSFFNILRSFHVQGDASLAEELVTRLLVRRIHIPCLPGHSHVCAVHAQRVPFLA